MQKQIESDSQDISEILRGAGYFVVEGAEETKKLIEYVGRRASPTPNLASDRSK